jgi:hypothetical protein
LIAGTSPSGNADRRLASRPRDSRRWGSEVAAEVVAAVDGPDDALDGDLLQAKVRPPRVREPAAHLAEGNELHQPARSIETSKRSLWRLSASVSPSNSPMRTMPSK